MIRAKQTCANCHFFVKEARSLPTSTPVVLHVSDGERRLAKAGDFSWARESYALACHFGVWDEGFDFDRQNRHGAIAETERRDFCFFWKYRPGMLLPPAKVLQEREAQNKEAPSDQRLTLWGLWMAAAALVANVWLTVAQHLKLRPFRNP